MLGQRIALWQTCGATSIGARGCAPAPRGVVTRAFKKNRGGNRPGFADPPSNPGYNLPPLDAPGYGPPQQQRGPPPQQQQGQQQQQQQQQQYMPPPPQQQPGWDPSPAGQPGPGQQAPPPPAQPAVQSPPPPAQPGFGNGQPPPQQQQQPGFVNSPPPAAPMSAPPQQAPSAAQPGFQQQQGFVQNPAQGYPQQGGQQQQGGYNVGGWQQQPQQQQGGYQQQQAWSDVGSFTDADMGGYIDSNGRVNPNDAGGYINPPQQRNGWSQQGGNQTQGYYRTNRQQQQQQQNPYLDGGYMNDQGGGGWNQGGQQRGNRPGFAGFDTTGPADWTDDFLLRQLDASNRQPNMMPDWSEVVEQEVVEDMTPKYVNGKRVLVNSEIEAPKVRVQDGTKGDLGVMTFQEAREMSFAQDVDVVMITEDADPPVVRLISFSKYKYELEKSAKQKQKASKGPEIKEVKLRPVTEKADYETKVKQAQKFLSKGAKVKLTMTFSGREMRFKDQGKEMMLKLIEELSETSKMEAPLALRPSNFSVTLVPLK